MSNLIMSKRTFLTGLFAAPAIIAADRLMPVRTIVAATGAGDLDKWVLIQQKFSGWDRLATKVVEALSEPVWMRQSDYFSYSGETKVLRRVTLPFAVVKPSGRAGWEVSKLHEIQQAGVIQSELPSFLQKYSIEEEMKINAEPIVPKEKTELIGFLDTYQEKADAFRRALWWDK